MREQEWIEIGHIVAAQGLEGQVRVYPDSDFPERFLVPGTRWIQRVGETTPQPIELLEGRLIPGKGVYVVALEGVETREQAEALRKAKILVPAGDRPPLAPGEYHVRDLLGLEVWLQPTGERLGVVIDVISAGNDLLEVQLESAAGEKIMVIPQREKPPGAPLPNRKSKIRAARGKLAKSKTVLIPFVETIVPLVDLEQGRVEITPPKGLLE